MKKIFLPGLVAGIMMNVVNALLNPIINFLFPGLQDAYKNTAFRPWDDPVMSLFFLYPILLAFPMSYIWDKTKALFNSLYHVKPV